MRGVRCGLTVWLMAIAMAAQALEPLSDSEFSGLLEEIHQLNRWNLERAAELAGPAENSLAFEDTLAKQVRCAVALAPSQAQRKGYRRVWQELDSMLSPARESPMASRLVPELRFGLSDLALRQGEVRLSMRQLIDAFRYLDSSASDSLQWRLLEQTARVNLAAGYPFDALHAIEHLEEAGALALPDRRFHYQLLRAEALGDARRFDEMARVLNEVGEAIHRHADSPRMAAFWVLKAWEALYDSMLDEAATYLQVARQEAEETDGPGVLGEIRFLEVLLATVPEREAAPARLNLEEVGKLFFRAGNPGRYAHLLVKVDNLPREKIPSRQLRPYTVELAKFAHREANLRAHSHGLAAWARLMLDNAEFNPDLFADASQRSLRNLEHFAWIFGKLQVTLGSAAEHEPKPVGGSANTGGSYYFLILLLLLLVTSLVLALRIHTQQHVNRQLAKTVAKARAAEAAAEESNRLKSQFLANVSHEIKTPMSGLVGMASLLDELIVDPSQRKYLETIRTCSENMLVLMNDLLDLGRMESGRFEIEHRPVRPVELVNYGVQMVLEAANRKNLEIIEKIEPEVPGQVICDGTRIGQILTNLLNNAIKFTERGLITVHLRYEQTVGTAGNLVIAVSDTGIGIPTDRMASVFEPFNQGPSVPEKKEAGSGLGLAICKKLTELMGGAIRVESEPGKGSCFTVRIPVTT